MFILFKQGGTIAEGDCPSIALRVVRIIELNSRFTSSTICGLGHRRWVYLKGCVLNVEQAKAPGGKVRYIDDVETVINELMVAPAGTPPYRTQRAVGPRV